MSVGRGVFWKKNTVEDALRLDTSRLCKYIDFDIAASGFTSWNNGNSQIGWEVRPGSGMRLYYTATKHNREPVSLSYWVTMESTPCYFGGKRLWFRCPNTNCNRRCRILYKAPSSDYFLCRMCQNLTYRSQQEATTKADAIVAYLFEMPAIQQELMFGHCSAKRRRRLVQRLEKLYANGLAAHRLLEARRKT
jgi:hypothetical protein